MGEIGHIPNTAVALQWGSTSRLHPEKNLLEIVNQKS